MIFQACTSGNSFQQVVKAGLRDLLRALQAELPEAEAESHGVAPEPGIDVFYGPHQLRRPADFPMLDLKKLKPEYFLPAQDHAEAHRLCDIQILDLKTFSSARWAAAFR